MTKYYCPSTGYFYDSELNTDIPDDAQKLLDEEFARLMEGQCNGSVIVNKGGVPTLEAQSCGECTGIAHDATVASADTLGHVKVGGGLQLAEDGTISIAELDDSAFVHKTGDETITGNKTLYGKTTAYGALVHSPAGSHQGIAATARSYGIGKTPADEAAAGDSHRGYYVRDVSGGFIGSFMAGVSTAGETVAEVRARNKFAGGALSSSGEEVIAEFKVGVDAEGTKFFTADDAQYAGDLVPYGSAQSIGSINAAWDQVFANVFQGDLTGTAAYAEQATNATNDGAGNEIAATYGSALQTSMSASTLALKNPNGKVLTNVSLSYPVANVLANAMSVGSIALVAVNSSADTDNDQFVMAGTAVSGSSLHAIQLKFAGVTAESGVYLVKPTQVLGLSIYGGQTPSGTWKLLTHAVFSAIDGASISHSAIALAVRTA